MNNFYSGIIYLEKIVIKEFVDVLNNFYCILLFIMCYSSYVKVSFGFVFLKFFLRKFVVRCTCYEGFVWL